MWDVGAPFSGKRCYRRGNMESKEHKNIRFQLLDTNK